MHSATCIIPSFITREIERECLFGERRKREKERERERKREREREKERKQKRERERKRKRERERERERDGECVAKQDRIRGTQEFISHKAFLESFGKNRFPHKSVNLFFILVIVKNKMTDLRGSCLQQTTLKTLCAR